MLNLEGADIAGGNRIVIAIDGAGELALVCIETASEFAVVDGGAVRQKSMGPCRTAVGAEVVVPFSYTELPR